LCRLRLEKIKEVDEKIAEVRSGTAEEYRIPLQKLKKKKNARLEVNTALRHFKLISGNHEYEAKEQSMKQNLEVV